MYPLIECRDGNLKGITQGRNGRIPCEIGIQDKKDKAQRIGSKGDEEIWKKCMCGLTGGAVYPVDKDVRFPSDRIPYSDQGSVVAAVRGKTVFSPTVWAHL
jgi:hypothetical protein